MSAKIIRIFLVLLGVLALALSLPGLYRKIFEQRPEKKWIYFSEITKDFVISEEVTDPITGHTRMIYGNSRNESYTEREYTKLLPFLNIRKLALMEELPDSIGGVPFDREVQQNVKRGMLMPEYTFTYRLNPLFESQSGLVRPVQPDDLFRINRRGVEFIDPETNRVLEDKSRKFNDALMATGFRLPADGIYGIPSVLKSRDDGYFITDCDGVLHHMLMVRGEPVCRRIETPVTIHSMKCTVPGDIYAYIYDDRLQLYVLQLDYTIKKLPMPPSNGRYIFSHNVFYKTFKNTDSDSTHMYVMDSNWDLVAQHTMAADSYSKSREALIESYIFPFRLMTPPGYAHLVPIPNPVGRFIWLNLAFVTLFVVIKTVKRRRLGNPFTIVDILCIAVFGIFGFIAVLVFPNRN